LEKQDVVKDLITGGNNYNGYFIIVANMGEKEYNTVD